MSRDGERVSMEPPDGTERSGLSKLEQELLGRPQVGDSILVDCTAYGAPGHHWVPVTKTSYWSASTYPIKVQIPGKGEGQFKPEEVVDRRPSRQETMEL